jgi:hypothetical protein
LICKIIWSINSKPKKLGRLFVNDLVLDLSILKVTFALSGYIFFAFSLTRVAEKFVKHRYNHPDYGKLAFEASSAFQFLFWLPALTGSVPGWIAYGLPFFREIFDIIWIYILRPGQFTLKYKTFINGHHLSSTVSRLLILPLVVWLVPKNFHDSAWRILLLYYCCSIFLVTPEFFERLMLGNRSQDVKKCWRLLWFFLTRLSHGAVILAAIAMFCPKIATFWGNPLPSVAFTGILLLGYAQNEWHSVKSGWPILLQSWRKAATKVGVVEFNS